MTQGEFLPIEHREGDDPSPVQNPTRRELEVLALVDEGLTSKQIARCLSISHNTVDTHRKNVASKLNVPGSRRACAKARALGLLSRPDVRAVHAVEARRGGASPGRPDGRAGPRAASAVMAELPAGPG